MSQQIQLRNDTAANWTTVNPVLRAGEVGVEWDTGKLKTGNGTLAWNSLAYVAGSGGATAYSALTDAATANLPVTNTPLATVLAAHVAAYGAKATLQSGALAGSTTVAPNAQGVVDAIAAVPTLPVSTTYAVAIPLDLVQGREMGLNSITTNTTYTIGSGAVLNGNCNITVIRDGTSTLNLSAFTVRGDTIVNTAGQVYQLAFVKRPDAAYVFVTAGGVIDVTAPQPQTIHVDDATPTVFRVTFNEALVTNGIVAGDCTVSGRSVSSIAISGVELQITVTVAAVPGASYTLSVGPNKLKDAAGNLCAAISSQPVTNNLLPVFTAQSPPAGTVGTAYSYTFVATGAASYAVASGTLPAGVTLNTSTGVISGTPTTAATSTFVISATNPAGTTSSASQSVVVSTGSGSVLFTDNFTGSDGASASTGYTTAGSSPVWKIQSNHLTLDSGSGFLLRDYPTARSLSIQATKYGYHNFQLVFKFTDTNNYWYVKTSTAAREAQLYKVVSGTATQVASSATGAMNDQSNPPDLNNIVAVSWNDSTKRVIVTRTVSGTTTTPLDVTLTGTDATDFGMTGTKVGLYDDNVNVGYCYQDTFIVTT